MAHAPLLMEALSTDSATPAMLAMIVEPMKEIISDMDKFQQMIEQTIDLEAAEKNDFMVKADFDPELEGTLITIKLSNNLSSFFKI